MKLIRICLFFLVLLVCGRVSAQQSASPLITKGWAALTKDNEILAFRLFSQAYEKAEEKNDLAGKAEASLYLGICTYGASPDKGMQYATSALTFYEKLQTSKPHTANVGRARCLQLISTIYIRQGKESRAALMSREVIAILQNESDTNGTLGLAYSTLGDLYEKAGKTDSVAVFYRLASQEFERSGISSYLPSAYIKRGKIADRQGDFRSSFASYSKALSIARKTENRQAQVSSLIALGSWYERAGDRNSALDQFLSARKTASGLSDKLFEIRALVKIIEIRHLQRDFEAESQLQHELLGLKDSVYTLEKAQIIKNLEVKFEVSEKDKELALVSKQKELTALTNLFLISGILLLLIIFAIVFFLMKRIQRKERILLRTKGELVTALEEQEKIREEQFRTDLEYKESQLSAITLQMLQKNELLNDIRNIAENKESVSGRELTGLVNRYFTHDSHWKDFDKYFESINTHFYTRLKKQYPDISGNDLKICALIRLNLNVKEMASVLNISPDSVKTARYRLRKKLQLTTEDNLNTFILAL